MRALSTKEYRMRLRSRDCPSQIDQVVILLLYAAQNIEALRKI